MSVKSIRFITSVSSLISLLSLCLVYLSNGERGVLKSPIFRVWVLMYALTFNNVSFTYVGAFILGA